MKPTSRLQFIFSIVFLGSLATSSTALAQGGWVSGGGDPLRFYFEEGRLLAKQMVAKFDANQVPPRYSDDIKAWILTQRLALQDDIERSVHEWSVDSQITCGLTTFTNSAAIRWSVEACRSISSDEEAAKMVLHETVHHFGIQDEAFADNVALAISAAYETLKTKEVPLCSKADDDEGITEGIKGTWKFVPMLSRRLGNGTVPALLTGQISFVNRLDETKSFKGVGHCALAAGQMTFTVDRKVTRVPYLIVDRKGTPVLITHKTVDRMPVRTPRRVPRVPGLLKDYRAWSVRLIQGSIPQKDLLFLGDQEDSETLSAFDRQ